MRENFESGQAGAIGAVNATGASTHQFTAHARCPATRGGR
jgi:hypothetical protein